MVDPAARVGRLLAGLRAAVVAVAAGLLAVACEGAPATGPTGSPLPSTYVTGPVVAQRWFAARAEALRQATGNGAAFYAHDAVLDHSALGHEPAVGWGAALQVLDAQSSYERIPIEPVYLSQDAAITIERIRDGSRLVNDLLPGSVVFLHEMTGAGIAAETLAPGVSELWALSRHNVREGPAVRAALQLADRLIRAWAAGDPAAVAALYATRAELADSVLGLDVQGRDAVARLAAGPVASGGLADAELRTMPGGDSPAVYAAGPWEDGAPFDHLVVLAEDPASLDRIAVELRLNPRGLIVEETRHHRVDAVLRKTPAPPGWWDDVRVPEPVPHELTSTESFGSSDVEIYNGTPGLAAIVPWAAQRFAAVGLEPPTITSVTFHHPGVDLCAGITGQIAGGAITLCHHASTSCTDSACSGWRPHAKETLLHELGHAWIDANLDATGRAQFLAHSGKPTWASGDHRWEDRGVELAATTLAWALMDEPFPLNPRLGLATCAELAGYFEVLTGFAPPESVPCTRP